MKICHFKDASETSIRTVRQNASVVWTLVWVILTSPFSGSSQLYLQMFRFFTHPSVCLLDLFSLFIILFVYIAFDQSISYQLMLGEIRCFFLLPTKSMFDLYDFSVFMVVMLYLSGCLDSRVHRKSVLRKTCCFAHLFSFRCPSAKDKNWLFGLLSYSFFFCFLSSNVALFFFCPSFVFFFLRFLFLTVALLSFDLAENSFPLSLKAFLSPTLTVPWEEI